MISQGAATANYLYLVSTARVQLRMNSTKAEVKQYDQWSFGEMLQYARRRQGPGLGKGSQDQDGAADPLQDNRPDPWSKGKGMSEKEGEKKGKKPEEFVLSPGSPPTTPP